MQESCTTLIGCTQSVQVCKYKITCNPLKEAFLISEVVWPIPVPVVIQLLQTDCFKHFDYLKSTEWNNMKVSKIVYFVYFLLQDPISLSLIP
jgi:hypothetical protein